MIIKIKIVKIIIIIGFTIYLQKPPVSFFLDNLEPGTSYRLIMFAANAKGRSEPTVIDDISFKGVAKYTGER